MAGGHENLRFFNLKNMQIYIILDHYYDHICVEKSKKLVQIINKLKKSTGTRLLPFEKVLRLSFIMVGKTLAICSSLDSKVSCFLSNFCC